LHEVKYYNRYELSDYIVFDEVCTVVSRLKPRASADWSKSPDGARTANVSVVVHNREGSALLQDATVVAVPLSAIWVRSSECWKGGEAGARSSYSEQKQPH